ATDGTSRWPLLLGRAAQFVTLLRRACYKRLGVMREYLPNVPRELTESSSTGTVLQQLKRVRLPNGIEEIKGSILAEFQAGQRQTVLYVGFCPPFELLPRVDARAAEDLEAVVKLEQVLHTGTKLEIRLSEPAEVPIAVSIQFTATERE